MGHRTINYRRDYNRGSNEDWLVNLEEEDKAKQPKEKRQSWLHSKNKVFAQNDWINDKETFDEEKKIKDFSKFKGAFNKEKEDIYRKLADKTLQKAYEAAREEVES